MKKNLTYLILILSSVTTLFCQERGIILQKRFNKTTFPSGWSIMGNGASNYMIAHSCNADDESNELQFGWTPIFQ